jgi:hypothetical protein
MKPSQIETLDIKRNPIIAINKKLNKSRKMKLPQFKIDNFENDVKNTNLLDIFESVNKKRVAKP